MKTGVLLKLAIFFLLAVSFALGAQLKLNDHDYFEAQGVTNAADALAK